MVEHDAVRLKKEEIPEQGMAPLSIEVGHFYPSEIEVTESNRRELTRKFRIIGEQVSNITASLAIDHKEVSLCLMIDDYQRPGSKKNPPPSTALPFIRMCALESGVDINYIGREAAFEDPARILLNTLRDAPDSLLKDPQRPRPPVQESGWLARRNPPTIIYRRGAQSQQRYHQLTLDVQLFSTEENGIELSCPLLAAAWQASRLGYFGVRPVPLSIASDELGKDWNKLPPIMKITGENTPPFAAERSFSILTPTYMPVESAVRVILNQSSLNEQPPASLVALNPQPLKALTARMDYSFVCG